VAESNGIEDEDGLLNECGVCERKWSGHEDGDGMWVEQGMYSGIGK
jgi:hypothetical protein